MRDGDAIQLRLAVGGGADDGERDAEVDDRDEGDADQRRRPDVTGGISELR